jgi:hypothetical protein
MLKFLIGPVLMGAGWVAGSYYGAQVQQFVHKSPLATYEGFSHAIDGLPQSGMTSFDGGTPMTYQLVVDRMPEEQLVVHVMFDGREAGWTRLTFAPQNDGNDTLITATAHSDRQALSNALAGTSRARLAYAPAWMLNLLTLRPQLQQVAGQIERGESPTIGGWSPPQPT